MPGELVVVKGEHRGEFVRVLTQPVTIGRSADADLPLTEDTKVSSAHVRVTPLGNERYLLEDVGSTNGTFVNSEKIEAIPLRSGDLIKIGRSMIVFRNDGSAVRLEDVALLGGGSSESLARRGDALERAAESSSTALPRGEPRVELSESLVELIRAAGEIGLRRGLHQILDKLRKATGAERAMAFLRHSQTGGLGRAATAKADDAEDAPVEPRVLEQAAAGEAASYQDAAAVPVLILGVTAGVLYIDGCPDASKQVRLLSLAGVLTGLHVGLDRSRNLASSATEIVAVGEVSESRRTFDVGALVHSADRLYGPVARQRGLTWSVDMPAPVLAMGDPILFGRGFDRLIEHVLSEAKSVIKLVAHPFDGTSVRVWVQIVTSDPGAVTATQVDPRGVAADLRQAGSTFGDGVLAVARACFLRAGVEFELEVKGPNMMFSLELEKPGSLTDPEPDSDESESTL